MRLAINPIGAFSYSCMKLQRWMPSFGSTWLVTTICPFRIFFCPVAVILAAKGALASAKILAYAPMCNSKRNFTLDLVVS